MGLKEQFRDLQPVDNDLLEQKQNEVNHLWRRFDIGDITQEELTFMLEEINSQYVIPEIRLKYPGPLYGLLRNVLSYDKNEARAVADEERAHYFKAREWNAAPAIVFQILQTVLQEEVIKELQISVTYTIPKDLTDDKVRQMNEEIALAYIHPSDDDLAKIGR